ncbi:MAG: DUF4358 domain-containing protein [Eubacteriales bacterium]|nr:DUF4358 domain-containing protein [Eubacteriales bacterium]
MKSKSERELNPNPHSEIEQEQERLLDEVQADAATSPRQSLVAERFFAAQRSSEGLSREEASETAPSGTSESSSQMPPSEVTSPVAVYHAGLGNIEALTASTPSETVASDWADESAKNSKTNYKRLHIGDGIELSQIESIQRDRAQLLVKALRKFTLGALLFALALALLIYGIEAGLDFRYGESAKSSGKSQIDFFRSEGLKSFPLENEAPYLSNRDKVLLRLEAAAKSMDDSDDESASGSERLAADSSGTSMLSDNRLEELGIAANQLLAWASQPSPPYKKLKTLFQKSDYGDVYAWIDSRKLVTAATETPGGRQLQYPYLSLYTPTEYPLIPKSDVADPSFFDDACFIGDSVFAVFSAGSTLGGDHFTRPIMAVESCLDDFVFTNQDGVSGNVRTLLAKRKYGKVYLLLGTNDGYRKPEDYIEKYRQVIRDIRKLQATAQIYIFTLFPVSGDYEQEGKLPSNRIFSTFNQGLWKLCGEENCFLLDYGDFLRNDYGVLNDGEAADGIHFTIRLVPEWCTYIQSHTFQGALGLYDKQLSPPSEAQVMADREVLKEHLQAMIPTYDAEGNLVQAGRVDPDVTRLSSSRGPSIPVAAAGEKYPDEEELSNYYRQQFPNASEAANAYLDRVYRGVLKEVDFEDQMSAIRTNSISQLYGIDASQLVSARILRSTGATAEELVFFLFESKSEALEARPKIKSYLSQRETTYRDYAPAELPRIQSANPIQSGAYLFFIVSDRNDVLAQVLEE